MRRTIPTFLLVLAGLLAMLGGLPSAHGQTPAATRIAAVVNDDIISTQDLRNRLRLALLLSGLPGDPETQRRLAPQVLQRVIDERLQLQEARRRGVVIPPEELDAAVRSTAAANNMTVDQLEAFLADQGVERATLEQQIEAEMTWRRFVQREFTGRIVITDQQLALAAASAAKGEHEEVLVSEILLPIYDPADTRQVQSDAEALRATIREGADFSALARQVSAAPSRDDGGDLGWVSLDAVQTALRPILAALGPGQISDPVTTPSGVQLFYVRDRRTASTRSGADLRQVSQLLFPVAPNATEAEVEAALADARQATASIADCRDMEQVARQRALPQSGDLGWMRPGDLPPEMLSVIGSLPLTTLSRPIRTVSGLHFLMICADGRSDAEAAERAELRRSLEQAQLELLAGRYLRDLRKDAFIDVRISG